MRTHRLTSLGTLRAALTLLVATACSTATAYRPLPLATPGESPDASQLALPQRAILSQAELASVHGPISTVEAVRRLRPEFLYPSVRASGRDVPDVKLYVNDTYEGDVWALNLLPLYLIRDITFLHPNEAAVRFGTRCRCSGGVVSVRTLIRGK